MNVVARDPADLRPLTFLKQIPGAEMADDDPRFVALCDDVLARRALAEPLKITEENLVIDLDSWARLRAAKRAQIDRVFCVVVPLGEVAGAFVTSLLLRRHYTKSGLAYLVYPLLKDAHAEAKARWEKSLKNPNKSNAHSVRIGASVKDLAERLGISLRFFEYAAKVHELFRKDAEFKAEMEWRLLTNDENESASLGGVCQAYAGRKATKGVPKQERPVEMLVKVALKELTLRSLRVTDKQEIYAAVASYFRQQGQEGKLPRWAIRGGLTRQHVEGLITVGDALKEEGKTYLRKIEKRGV